MAGDQVKFRAAYKAMVEAREAYDATWNEMVSGKRQPDREVMLKLADTLRLRHQDFEEAGKGIVGWR